MLDVSNRGELLGICWLRSKVLDDAIALQTADALAVSPLIACLRPRDASKEQVQTWLTALKGKELIGRAPNDINDLDTLFAHDDPKITATRLRECLTRLQSAESLFRGPFMVFEILKQLALSVRCTLKCCGQDDTIRANLTEVMALCKTNFRQNVCFPTRCLEEHSII